jgi:hypothetical protein
MKKALLVPLSALALLAAASCSSVSASSERLIGSPAYPPTSPAAVVILRREPRKPHERVGHVFVEPSGGPPVEEIEKAIRTEAARLGADAAVIVFDRTRRVGRVYQGPWWDRTTYPIYGRKIIAVAIRYRGERETRD